MTGDGADAANTAAWVEARMDAVFAAFSAEVVDRTLPVLLLLLARDFGIDALEPSIQDAVFRVLEDAGLEPGLSNEEIARRTTAYVEGLDYDHDLLRAVTEVFDRHYDALAQRGEGDFKRLVDERSDRTAPSHDAVRPPNTETAEALSRKLTKRIRS